jgi:hypothetical protein
MKSRIGLWHEFHALAIFAALGGLFALQQWQQW